MTHVRTQLRNAIKTRLETISALAGVHNMSRTTRDFQSRNFPLALVNLGESVTQMQGSFPGEQPQIRSYKIMVQLGVLSSIDDPEGALDDLTVDVEKVLADPQLGISTLSGWAYTGSVAETPVETDAGVMISQTLMYEANLMTLDSAPDETL